MILSDVSLVPGTDNLCTQVFTVLCNPEFIQNTTSNQVLKFTSLRLHRKISQNLASVRYAVLLNASVVCLILWSVYSSCVYISSFLCI